ncbi:NfeD family protein [Nocardia otitidiscaviarum]|uniref:NfeD family protein n=1 Tax=Nocardia otitidiscaviarum TaxID=1823 RepID=UPI002B4AD516|nr:nodulation protein NfeD [Nocardia otitidiscaviarum]
MNTGPHRSAIAPALLLLLAGAVALVSALLGGGTAHGQQADSGVLATSVDGPITTVVADHLREGVQRAEREQRRAFLLELDTPGGLDTAMRAIVREFLDAQVPVVVYVAPSGARAASAGSIITSAAHIAAMAPGTTIGAATPVDAASGEEAGGKVVEDAAAYAVSIAEQRGRDTEFAEDTVREGRAVTDREAVEIGAVDLVAADRATLLTEIDGRTVRLADGTETTLRTAGAAVDDYHMGTFAQLRQTLANPTLAFLLLSLGSLAILYELASPGAGLGGVLGAVMLALAFVSLAVLPVNIAGLLLLGLAVALFVAELFTPGIGVFAAGGAIALAVSGLMLFDEPFDVDPRVLWPTAVVVGLGAVLAGRLALRARRAPTVSGSQTLIGQETTIEEAEGERGRARLEGSWWNVRSDGPPLRAGQRVRVVDLHELTLVVEPLTPEKK